MTHCNTSTPLEFQMKRVNVLISIVSSLIMGSAAFAASQSPNDYLGSWQMDMQNSSADCVSDLSTTPGMQISRSGDTATAVLWTGPVATGTGLGAASRSLSISENSGQGSWSLEEAKDGSQTLRYDGQWFDGNASGCVFKRVAADQPDRQQSGDNSVCGSFPFFRADCGNQ